MAGFWGDYRDCDVPWRTVEASLKDIRENHPDADLVYWTGDIIDHTVWLTSKPRIELDLGHIYKLLGVEFNNTKILPVLGNHEPHPVNQYAPAHIEGEFSMDWFYDTLVKDWSDWLSSDALDSVRKGGYYTESILRGFRVIVLNNNDGYTDNFWLVYEADFLRIQLQWLHDTLLQAEEDKEKVHILLHIPPGKGGHYNIWRREYTRIVERFHQTIIAHFCGHTHKNEFNVFYDRTNAKFATSLTFNGGSLTPYSDVNPNYVVYYVDKTSFEIVDADFYYFDLDEVNQSSAPPQFTKLYSFKEQWSMPDMSPKSFNALLERWSNDVNGELRRVSRFRRARKIE